MALPAIAAAIGGVLLNMAGSIVAQVLVSLAISVVTYTGVDLVLNRLKGDAISALLGLPPELVALLSYMQVGVAISIITSAIAVRMGLNGMDGAVKRFRKK